MFVSILKINIDRSGRLSDEASAVRFYLMRGYSNSSLLLDVKQKTAKLGTYYIMINRTDCYCIITFNTIMKYNFSCVSTYTISPQFVNIYYQLKLVRWRHHTHPRVSKQHAGTRKQQAQNPGATAHESSINFTETKLTNFNKSWTFTSNWPYCTCDIWQCI